MSSFFKEQYTASLEAALAVYYGAGSRANPEDISREVLALNDAIGHLANQYLAPLSPIMDFKQSLLQHMDSSNLHEEQ